MKDQLKNMALWSSGRWAMNGMGAKMFVEQDGLCCYCEKLMSYPIPETAMMDLAKNVATREHLLERCEGGGDDPGNLRLACAPCNHGRHNRPWMIWKSMKMREPIDQWALKYIDPNNCKQLTSGR